MRYQKNLGLKLRSIGFAFQYHEKQAENAENFQSKLDYEVYKKKVSIITIQVTIDHDDKKCFIELEPERSYARLNGISDLNDFIVLEKLIKGKQVNRTFNEEGD
jgi:hypothetical protein